MYRATNDEDPIYKTWAKKKYNQPYSIMGYTYIGPLASFEVWRQGLGGASALASNVGFIETKIQTTGVFKISLKTVDGEQHVRPDLLLLNTRSLTLPMMIRQHGHTILIVLKTTSIGLLVTLEVLRDLM
jgi:hypothetical protein